MSSKKNIVDNLENQMEASQLMKEFKTFMADAEALIKATAHHEEGPISSVRAKMMDTLADVKETMADAENSFNHKAREVLDSSDLLVRKNPWGAVGIAAGAGLLIGLLISRR
jgi:ElaB/YqjD/DUF883 family membrane-anchored ribosome-binding protein